MSASQLPTVRKMTATLRRATAANAGQEAPEYEGHEPHGHNDQTAHNNSTAEKHRRVVLGRYRLHHRLGTGAFGAVWAARDEQLERDVAVKIMPNERIFKGRFEREARAAARLSHPAIVTLFEALTDQDDAYLVSELVRGGTLEQLLQAGRLSDRDILEVALSLCDALAHAHAHGIVHRDVKPSNVLIPDRPSSDAYPAKLTDFGVARVLGGDSLTRTGDVIGTAAYMAPEQAEGREASAAADLYALALVTYEALTGVNPVRTNTAAMRARRLGAHLPPLRRQRRDLPHALGRAIDQALRPRPRERATLEELRAGLLDTLEEVDDRPGIVAPAWRPGIVAPAWRPRHRASAHETARPEQGEPPDEAFLDDEPTEERIAWPSRAVAAAVAAATFAWLASRVLPTSTLAPTAAAAGAGFAVLLFPRIGWVASTTAIAALGAVQHRPGAALLVVLAAIIPVAVLPGSGIAWPLSAGAPALGMIGLAGAWPAVAAVGHRAYRRAVLGATGWIWLLLAAPLANGALYAKLSPPPAGWASSISSTFDFVLKPIATSGVLLAAPVWAISALTLPYLVRRRSLAFDFVLTVIWAALTVAFTQAATTLVHHAHGAATLPTAAAGAVAAAAFALAPAVLVAVRERRHSRGLAPELP